MEFNDMPGQTNEDETVVPASNSGQTFWENEFTGKDIKPGELEFAKVVASDYCTDEQRKELEQTLDPDGATLGSSRTLIRKFAQLGDRLLQEQEERKSSPGRNFYGKSMDSPALERAREKDAQSLVANAIEKAKAEIILRGRRPLPGRLHK